MLRCEKLWCIEATLKLFGIAGGQCVSRESGKKGVYIGKKRATH